MLVNNHTGEGRTKVRSFLPDLASQAIAEQSYEPVTNVFPFGE